MVSVAQLIGHVEQTAGGPISDSLGGAITIVNAAGRHLYSAHQWRAAIRSTGALNFVSGTNYVVLPADFGSEVETYLTDSQANQIRLRVHRTVLEMRTSGFGQYGYDAVYSWRVLGTAITGLTEDTVQPVLEVWPTPTAAGTGAITMWYRAKWVELANDNTVVLVPPFMETLLIALCRAFARGYEAEEQGSESQRIAEIEAGPLWAAAIAQDNAMQTNFGPMLGGDLNCAEGRIYDPISNAVTVTL